MAQTIDPTTTASTAVPYNITMSPAAAGNSAPSTPTSSTPPSEQTNFSGLTARVNAALGGSYFDEKTGAQVKQFVPQGIPNPAPAPGASGITPPTLPQPKAQANQGAYLQSSTAAAAAARTALQNSYDSSKTDIQNKINGTQANIDSLNSKEGATVDQINQASQPFRADYEAQQRQALFIDQNFQANQKLVDELDQLLTQGNALMEQQKGQPIASNIQSALVGKTQADIAARAGVIQAVLAARNNQIDQAEKMIDRSVAAMNADRQDQIDYYKTVLTFYQGQKDDAGKQLLTLNSDMKDMVDKQLSLLENDVKNTQTNADNIKQAMQDPTKAQAYADAGVTLNDSPEQINTKLANYAYTKELSDNSASMAKSGYTAVIPGQKAPAGAKTVTVTDSRGVDHTWYEQPSATSTQSESADRQSMASTLKTRVGQDGYVSPQDYSTAKKAWVGAGYKPADFDTYYSVYRNPNDTGYQLG